MTTKALSTVSAPSLPIDASTLPDDARLSHLIRNDHLLRALGTKCDKLIKQRAVLIKLIPALIERRTEAVDKYNDLAKERNAQVDVHKAMVDKLQKMLGPMEFVRVSESFVALYLTHQMDFDRFRGTKVKEGKINAGNIVDSTSCFFLFLRFQENAQLVSDLLDSSNQQIEVLKSSSKLLQLAELHVRKQDAELVALRDRLEQIDKELKEGVEEMRVLSGGICGCCMDGEEHERKKELGEREVGKVGFWAGFPT